MIRDTKCCCMRMWCFAQVCRKSFSNSAKHLNFSHQKILLIIQSNDIFYLQISGNGMDFFSIV